MKPFPSDGTPSAMRQPVLQTTATMRYENRMAPRVPKIYPVLLVFSTMVAGAFCWLYLTKPVIEQITMVQAPPAPTAPVIATLPTLPSIKPADPTAPAKQSGATVTEAKPATPAIKLETPAQRQLPAAPANPYEESNLRIQHVLTATSPDGELGRIILDVPVLYQSRNLRWTPRDIREARELLSRLNTYQEKVRDLRSEGTALMGAWNALVARTLPVSVLRADSQSLPENQREAPSPSGALNSTDSIRIQPATR